MVTKSVLIFPQKVNKETSNIHTAYMYIHTQKHIFKLCFNNLFYFYSYIFFQNLKFLLHLSNWFCNNKMARHQLTYSIANNILLLLVFSSNKNNNIKNGHVQSYTLPANQVFTTQLFDRRLFQQVTILKNHRHAQDIY